MGVLLVGANPGIRLYEGHELTLYASLWRVDWSVQGAGRALVVWRPGQVRVLATDAALGGWLESYFTRRFPEAEGLEWPEPQREVADVEMTIDLDAGVQCRGGDVEIRMSRPLGRRAFATSEFDLGGTDHNLQLVIAPMGTASVTDSGVRVPGTPRVAGTPELRSSTAFVAVAEAWSLPDG